ncbi:MAG: putative nitrogen fixation protein NifT [Magnetococcales bacterium]|nr:putative nitrogen fixation protein NifT [Magnetococcales bacterium]
MPKIMLRKNAEGSLICYVAKKDLEAKVVALEFDEPTRWGGTLTLDDGSKLYVKLLDSPPALPIEMRATRG